MKLISDSLLTYEKRCYFISFFTIVFALIYHFSYLIAFGVLHVFPMMYFNVGSVLLFGCMFVFFNRFTQKKSFPCYVACFIEVITHQILALYFVGINTHFQFLIIIIGALPFLVFNKPVISVIFGGISSAVFVLTFVFDYIFYGTYTISNRAILIMGCVNISVSLFVILGVIMIFNMIVIKNETKLTKEKNTIQAELYNKNQKLIQYQDNTIIRMANLVELRDSDTGQHVLRTRTYARYISQKAKEKGYYFKIIDDKFIANIEKAAPLHDIGKISVSDLILKKKGKLTEEEFSQMQEHTTEGARILKELLFDQDDKKYVEMAINIAFYHHEKWDGKGYPKHLRGDQIPVCARIMALADVFDALISERCYKKPMTYEEAFKTIEENIGTHFDPFLGKLFIENKDELISMSKK